MQVKGGIKHWLYLLCTPNFLDIDKKMHQKHLKIEKYLMYWYSKGSWSSRKPNARYYPWMEQSQAQIKAGWGIDWEQTCRGLSGVGGWKKLDMTWQWVSRKPIICWHDQKAEWGDSDPLSSWDLTWSAASTSGTSTIRRTRTCLSKSRERPLSWSQS